VCFIAGFTVVPGLCIVPAAGAGVEPAVPEGCAAKAEPAIKLVASSAAANFVNIVFSFFRAPRRLRTKSLGTDRRGKTYTACTERRLKWRHA
jgi:hypothetical protein